MTDKQVIIDGCDVSGCKLFRNGICSSPINPKCKLCVEINEKMCYYKQLARKEQELKNICEAFDIEYIIDKETGNLIGRCNKLYKKEQECEELKRKCEENKTVFLQLQQWQDEDLRQIAELKRIKDDFFKQAEISQEVVLNKNKIIEKLEKEIVKYKQTFEEIKEIAEKHKATAHCDYLTDMEQILQKISESEVENAR